MVQTCPINAHLPEIKAVLEQSRCAVVHAPPGAGKTTRVPLALLSEPWLDRKKIILLEPRRLAARSCSAHMADLLKQRVGQTVGYQIRMDRNIGPDTRVEVVTEGIFTRKIQHDPSLDGVGLVIFDEFHERSIHSDLGLALCLETLEAFREDLRILVMSATMDVNAISRLMDDAPMIVSKGKSFPVKTIYTPTPQRQNRPQPIENTCARAIQRALEQTRGDVLVFLPGVKEIKRLHALVDGNLGPRVHVMTLYGNLSQADQARAFKASLPGHRKIVIATSIAETSITIDGVSVVIDSGRMRVPRFSPQTGMTRLETIPVSRASADQRRGRAGRTAPGTCVRLWSEYAHGLLKPFTVPAILSVDLANVALELAAWGVSDPGQLKWLDPPDKARFEQARGLLNTLGALDGQGHITAHGKKMVTMGLHPRLAHMVLKGMERGQGLLACYLAAFLAERDFVGFDKGPIDPDIRLRLEIIDALARKNAPGQTGGRINQGLVRRIVKTAHRMAVALKIPKRRMNLGRAGGILALAYPERIAKKRNSAGTTFLMASGKGAFFIAPNTVSGAEYIVAVHLDGNPQNAKIFLAARYSKQELEQDFSDGLESVRTLRWDKKTAAIQATQDIVFQRLVIEQQIVTKIDPDRACDMVIQEIQRAGIAILPWTRRLKGLKNRLIFLHHTRRFPDLPDVSDTALETTMDQWLKPFLAGVFSLKQLEQIDLESAFSSLLTWEQRQWVDKHAPTHIRVPSGSKKPLKYTSRSGLLDSPVLEVRLQEMFGLTTTPKIAGSSVPITLHLLSPAGRPVQITKDLESFWKHTYAEVKKDLMGRYPKHYWPQDPMDAMPTRRAKPRKSRS